MTILAPVATIATYVPPIATAIAPVLAYIPAILTDVAGFLPRGGGISAA